DPEQDYFADGMVDLQFGWRPDRRPPSRRPYSHRRLRYRASHQPATDSFRISIVQRSSHRLDQLVDLGLGNYQRRTNVHGLRGGEDEKSAIHGALLDHWTDTGGGG